MRAENKTRHGDCNMKTVGDDTQFSCRVGDPEIQEPKLSFRKNYKSSYTKQELRTNFDTNTICIDICREIYASRKAKRDMEIAK